MQKKNYQKKEMSKFLEKFFMFHICLSRKYELFHSEIQFDQDVAHTRKLFVTKKFQLAW